jgi:raffinose/stachyose/melibiose transport system permease protein
LVGYLYILPGLAIYVVFVLGPLVHAGWLSLFSWDGVTQGHWVGLANYREIASDPQLRGAFVHSLVLIGFYAILPIALGLVLAAALSRAPLRGLTAFRTALFLPQVVSTVVIGVIWRWLYDPDGPINSVLRSVGLGSAARPWLGDFSWALAAVGLIGAWITTGLCMVLFLSGVQKIPRDLYDAARVDGAGPFREFLAVTLPGLRNELSVAATLTIVGALRSFDVIFVTTGGGPGDATTVPGILIYRRAFTTGQVGSACALAVTLALIIFVITFLITRIGDRSEA